MAVWLSNRGGVAMLQPNIRRYLKHGTLPQLRVFEASARLGSLTRAAEELHIAQPTASVQIKKLTETVGLPLFEQVGRRVYLTDAGERLYARCHEVFRALSTIDETLNGLRSVERAHLRGALPHARTWVRHAPAGDEPVRAARAYAEDQTGAQHRRGDQGSHPCRPGRVDHVAVHARTGARAHATDLPGRRRVPAGKPLVLRLPGGQAAVGNGPRVHGFHPARNQSAGDAGHRPASAMDRRVLRASLAAPPWLPRQKC